MRKVLIFANKSENYEKSKTTAFSFWQGMDDERKSNSVTPTPAELE
jgi:hypothetical protein